MTTLADRVHPRLIGERFEFATTDVTDRILLTARAVGGQQFLQQGAIQRAIPLLRHAVPLVSPGRGELRFAYLAAKGVQCLCEKARYVHL